MNMNKLFLVSLIISTIISLAYGLCWNPDTADVVDVEKYAGFWYQIAADPFVDNTFEKGAVCVAANYTLFSNGTIGVVNQNRKDTVDGPKNSITGYAEIPDANFPGRLKVHLEGVPFAGQYWILKLGPVVGNQYTYSLVSDEACVSLFVLARTQSISNETTTEIQQYLSDVGFNIEKSYEPTVQAGCTYDV
eukprot:TRINITY_DN697_c0_g1_i1.p1 TRINITY_DN697_c0_g1~~TRINITY_DN697_c0_g1_i1.p1  ORF type:complete len:191 (-),score=39.72 TRINITY_DN697_c0_g1_i1:29-601(-)